MLNRNPICEVIMKLKSLVLILSLSSLSLAAQAATPSAKKLLFNLDQGSGGVEFNATGRPSALKIHGKGSAPKGSLVLEGTVASGSLSFDLESLDTGIKLRNEHMKTKYLEVGKYGKATLTIEKLSVPEALKTEAGKVEKAPFQGVLSLHGVQKPVSGFATIQRSGDQMTVAADFGIKTSEYGISTPSFAGITMAEDVQVAVQVSAPLVSQQ